jgi:hypothetical protein
MEYVPQEVAMLIEEIVSTSEEVGRDIHALEALQSDLHHMIQLHHEIVNDDVLDEEDDGDDDDDEDDDDEEEDDEEEEGREDVLSETEHLPDMIVDLPARTQQGEPSLSLERMED